MNKKFCTGLLFFCIIPLLYSQERIISFDNNWTVDLSVNYHFLRFDHEDLFGCRGNKPLDIGIGVRYKKVALGFHVELPFSSEFYNPASESFDLNLDYIEEKFIVDTFFSRYHSFFIDNYRTANPFAEGDSKVDLSILTTGVSFRWILNYEKHSLRGVYKLDRRQTISGGSPTFGCGAYYHSIHSADNKLPGYETRRHFIYTGPLAGYSYTWILGSGAFFNIDIVGGINPGLNTNEMKFVFVPALFPNLTFGFHFNTWSLISSVDVKFFIALQSYQLDTADWHQLSKINLTLLKVSKRF